MSSLASLVIAASHYFALKCPHSFSLSLQIKVNLYKFLFLLWYWFWYLRGRSAQFINKKSNFYSLDPQFSMDNYRGLIQDMSPQDREVTISSVYHFDPDTCSRKSNSCGCFCLSDFQV